MEVLHRDLDALGRDDRVHGCRGQETLTARLKHVRRALDEAAELEHAMFVGGRGGDIGALEDKRRLDIANITGHALGQGDHADARHSATVLREYRPTANGRGIREFELDRRGRRAGPSAACRRLAAVARRELRPGERRQGDARLPALIRRPEVHHALVENEEKFSFGHRDAGLITTAHERRPLRHAGWHGARIRCGRRGDGSGRPAARGPSERRTDVFRGRRRDLGISTRWRSDRRRRARREPQEREPGDDHQRERRAHAHHLQ
ncbi:MAG: hypothetical protein IPJ77_09320 [Planctomycetes bacterium]|nr:hypothetical protein [Planctomycetota bacterium]